MDNWLIFELDTKPFAIDLSLVELVINACEIITAQNQNNSKMGVINVHGDLIPIFDLRALFGFEVKDLNINDQFIILNFESTLFAIITSKAREVIEFSKDEASSLPSKVSYDYCNLALQHNNQLFPVLNVEEIQKRNLL